MNTVNKLSRDTFKQYPLLPPELIREFDGEFFAVFSHELGDGMFYLGNIRDGFSTLEGDKIKFEKINGSHCFELKD